MRMIPAWFVIGLAACDEAPHTDLALDVANPGQCANFQSPREVGDLATYSTDATAGFSVRDGNNADQVVLTMPPDAYGRPGRTLTLTRCDEHWHEQPEHVGACLIPVDDVPPYEVSDHEAPPEAIARAAPERPGAGTMIELHTAYAETVDGAATGLARCKGVAFVRASQWIVSADDPSDQLLGSVVRYAGSTTGAGDEACKPPAWWEVVLGCFTMSRDDARLSGHGHPARPLQTFLSPMKRFVLI